MDIANVVHENNSAFFECDKMQRMQEKDNKVADSQIFYIERETAAPLASPEAMSETASLCSDASFYNKRLKLLPPPVTMEPDPTRNFKSLSQDHSDQQSLRHWASPSPQPSLNSVSSEKSKQVKFGSFTNASPSTTNSRKVSILKGADADDASRIKLKDETSEGFRNTRTSDISSFYDSSFNGVSNV